MSGYVPCACRDCMDIAISATDAPQRCLLCKDADCEVCYERILGKDCTAGHSCECQREDAYTEGMADADRLDPQITVNPA